MDKGHVLQSLHMQQMIAESCPSWWNFNNMMKPPNYPQQLHNPSTNLLVPTNSTFIPHHIPPSSFSSSSSCHGNQDHLPNSWSQLLLGGVVAEEDRSCISNNIENESLEKWEEQIMPHHGPNESVKQENSTRSYIQGHGDIDQHHGVTRPTWSQLVPVSSPKSSCVTTATNLSTNMLDFSNKTEGKRSPSDHSSECNSTATGGTLKKARVQPSSSQPTFKVRKEKIGDRITTLHQIVSPFGKTDAASVLLETNGYIRFLQNQVEALGLPYLSKGGANMRQKQSESIEDPKKGLKSRGLCLVPLSCTLQFQSDNNGDYCSIWGGF